MNKKVLIIDDNKEDFVLMKEMLSSALEDSEFIPAETGEEGVKKAKEFNPELVIIDTQLPTMDGFEVCKQIKAIPDLNAKVIVLTGVMNAVNAAGARQAGADGYAVKTSDYQDLIEAIEQSAN